MNVTIGERYIYYSPTGPFWVLNVQVGDSDEVITVDEAFFNTSPEKAMANPVRKSRPRAVR